MKAEMYRYLVKNENLWKEFLARGKVFLTSPVVSKDMEELKSSLLKEGRETSRSLQTKVNTISRMKPGDYLWMKYKEEYALGKVTSYAIFHQGTFGIDLELYSVDSSNVPETLKRSFRGIDLSRILDKNVYDVTEEIFTLLKEKQMQDRPLHSEAQVAKKQAEMGKDTPKESQSAMEILSQSEKDRLELEFEKQRGELVKVHPPMVKEKNELTVYPPKEKRKLSKKERKDPTFELVIEMHAPKDLRIEKQSSHLPAVAKKRGELPIKDERHQVFEMFNQSVKFYLQWQRMNFEMYLQSQKMFYENYMAFVKLFMK